jgi:NAD(P)H-hydrate epimerase
MLPVDSYSATQVRARDAAVIAAGTPGYVLMQRAAAAALQVARAEWPLAREYAVVCGAGNNGGDGYVLAILLQAAGFAVRVFAATDPAKLQGDAALAYRAVLAGDLRVEPWGDAAPIALARSDVIVDAVLGIGLREAVRAPLAAVIGAINVAARPVLALDVPSGLCADTGKVQGIAVRAAATVTFIGVKSGCWLQAGPEHVGRLHLAALDVGMEASAVPVLRRIDDQLRSASLPPRVRDAHKGQSGRVLIVGGKPGMSGAVRLAGEAALRVGAGLVSVLTAPGSVAAVAARPELMVYGSDDAATLHELASRCDVLAIGPGLGRDDWSERMFEAALATRLPLVVDADALRRLADVPRLEPRDWILTPHPGEAAQLLGYDATGGNLRVQNDRLGALRALTARYGGVVVLKGAGTLVGREGDVPQWCAAGNPGMAVPGMGDVLTGAIAGLQAQLRDPWLAARLGVFVHACAGDTLAPRGERGLLASEVATELKHWVNP